MVADTSAIVALVRQEDDADELRRKMERADSLRLSAANYLESVMVLSGGTNDAMLASLDRFIALTGIAIEGVTAEDAELARNAFLTYGKGRHPAKLNFGDCFAYALAKRLGEPLLYKGTDFPQTDVMQA